MNQDLTKQIISQGAEALQKLAVTAGSTAIHLYSVLVKQQIIEGAISILQVILFFGLVYYPLKRIYQFIKDYQNDKDIGEGYNWAIGIVASALVIFVLINVVGLLGDAINKIINPEYYALKIVFETIKK